MLEINSQPGFMSVTQLCPLSEQVVQSLPEGLILLDEQGTVMFANTRAQQILGLSPQSLLNRNVLDVWADLEHWMEAKTDALRDFKRALETVAEYPVLTIHVRTQQSEFVRGLNLKLFPVRDEAGNPLVTGLSLRDLTPDQMRVRMKDELIHAVSHELRDPLTVVWGFAQLLRTRNLPEDKRAQAIDAIYLEAEHLSGMVHDLLDWRQMESGRYSIHCGPVDLAEVIRKTTQCIGNRWPDHSLQTNLPSALSRVRADAKGLEHVLRNLLTNACKYSPQGGSVIVAVNEFEAEARVTVTDKGLGLPPETIPHLFDGYYRVESDDRRAISGVGLGLAIVRRLVVEQGGRVWAESAGPGMGSTFGFTLPFFTRDEPAYPEDVGS